MEKKRRENEENVHNAYKPKVLNNRLNGQITHNEVETACLNARNKKAVGTDLVANELIKHESVIFVLYEFFRLIFEIGIIPAIRKQAIIHPIPKESGRQIDPLKYRGLALQSCVYKAFSSVLNSQIVGHLNENNLICDEQNGFPKGRSCQHHIFSLITILRN